MKTIKTSNAKLLKESAERFTTYLDTLYLEEKKMDGLWELANKVSEIACRLHSVKCMAEMQGEADSDNVSSGVSWGIADYVSILSDQLEEVSEQIMKLNREEIETKAPKGKKK